MMSTVDARRWLLWGALSLLGSTPVGCGRTHEVSETPPPRATAHKTAGANCPTEPLPAERAPDVSAKHLELATWLQQPREVDPQAVLMTPEAVASHNRAHVETPGAWRDPSDPAVGMPELIDASIDERMVWMQEQLAAGKFVETNVGALSRARELIGSSTAVDHERLVVTETQLYCVPSADGLYKDPPDLAFDRNACASLHPGERIRVLRRSASGKWLHVHAGHTVGWIHEATLTPRLRREQLDVLDSDRFVVSLRDDVKTTDGFPIRVGVRLPLVEEREDGTLVVMVPDETQGLREAQVASEGLSIGYPPLTRKAVFEMALSQLGEEYGWGGRAGHRDCSRFLRDLLFTFGLQLGRHSGVQALQGAYTVDLQGMDEAAKNAAIDRAAARGVVLLYMPGHIMLYLGRDGERPYAISAISEWLEPCEGGADTVHRIDRVAVTTLELGRNTERTAFIERLTRLAVFAPPLEEGPTDAGG
jgi:hypothetical protein